MCRFKLISIRLITLLEMKLIPSIAIALLTVGCVSIPPNSGFDYITEQVTEVGYTAPVWPGVTLSETEAQSRIQKLLEQPLTEETAIEIALLNNRYLRAMYLELKSAAWEYKDKASLPNPLVSANVLEIEDDQGTNLSYGFGIEVLDVFFLHRRMKTAGKTFEVKTTETIAGVLDFITDVRISYYNVVAAQQIANLMDQADEASNASAEVAQALFNAGNIAKVELDRERYLAAEISLDAMQARAALFASQERFNAKLGLDGESVPNWIIQSRLKNPPKEEVFVPFRISQNLYLSASDARIDALGTKLGIESASSFVGDIEFEVEREREEGEWANGIGLTFELPIFNWGSGARQAAGARLEAMIQKRIADSIELKAEARSLIGELQATRDTVLFQRTKLLPLAGQVLKGTQLDYNAMQVGVFELLDAKRDQLSAGRDYVSNLRDYWNLKARYEQMIAGGSIGGIEKSEATSSTESANRGDH